MSVPIPGNLPTVPARGGGAPETFSHAFTLFSSPFPPLGDPLLQSLSPAAGPALDTGRPGNGSYLPGKFPALRRGSPPPEPGLRARPAGRFAAASPPAPAAATVKAVLQPVPLPCSAHTRASLAARIPALARVPEGTFLSRARPGRASRAPPFLELRPLPGPAGARRANFPWGTGAGATPRGWSSWGLVPADGPLASLEETGPLGKRQGPSRTGRDG